MTCSLKFLEKLVCGVKTRTKTVLGILGLLKFSYPAVSFTRHLAYTFPGRLRREIYPDSTGVFPAKLLNFAFSGVVWPHMLCLAFSVFLKFL